MAVVLDASALGIALLDRSDAAEELRRRLRDDVCHAPHLVDAEIGSVLRGRVLRGALPAGKAEWLLLSAAPLVDHRHEMTGELARAAWALRENVSFYDGLYVALAAALGVPLLTADQRLRRAPALPCAIEPVAAAR